MFNYNRVIQELQTEYKKNKNTYQLGEIVSAPINNSDVRALVGLLVNKGILAPDDEAKQEMKDDKEPTFVVIYEVMMGNASIEEEAVWTLTELERNYKERDITKTIFIRERP